MALTLTRRPGEATHLWYRGEYLGSVTCRPGRGRDETKLVFDMPLAVQIARDELLDDDPRRAKTPSLFDSIPPDPEERDAEAAEYDRCRHEYIAAQPALAAGWQYDPAAATAGTFHYDFGRKYPAVARARRVGAAAGGRGHAEQRHPAHQADAALAPQGDLAARPAGRHAEGESAIP